MVCHLRAALLDLITKCAQSVKNSDRTVESVDNVAFELFILFHMKKENDSRVYRAIYEPANALNWEMALFKYQLLLFRRRCPTTDSRVCSPSAG